MSKFSGGPLHGMECGDNPLYCRFDWKDKEGVVHNYSVLDSDGADAVYDPEHQELKKHMIASSRIRITAVRAKAD